MGSDQAAPRLEDGVVHVWRLALTGEREDVLAARALLSEDELARADRFHFEHHRRRFAMARAGMRRILGRYSGVDPASLRFRYEAAGKPYFEDCGSLRFNLSHSDERALLAVASWLELGVDIEMVRDDTEAEKVASRYFSEFECHAIAALPAELRRRAFFDCWARKEALLKGVGGGLSLGLGEFDVTCSPGVPAELIASREPAIEAGLWTLHAIDAGPEYAAALAVGAAEARVVVRMFGSW